ncbi:MAG: energy transducer TonB [Rudaea sp.]
MHSKLTPVVAGIVDKDVRGWRFEPILVDGVAVVAKTAMFLRIKAEPGTKDNYTLRIEDVRFGGPRRADRTTPPHYPDEAVRSHVGAKVMVALRLDEDGNVADAQAYQTSLDARAGSEEQARHFRLLFERASLIAARHWHFDLSEKLNGKPVGTSALVPVVYSLVEGRFPHSDDGRWRSYLPGPVTPAPWMHQQVADNRSVDALAEGESLSLDSRFHLKSNVIGKAL